MAENDAENEKDSRRALDQEALQAQETGRISETIEEMPPADAAEMMAHLEPEKAADIAGYLDPITASRVLAEMDARDAARLIEGMPAAEASMILAEMEADDRVDVLEHVKAEIHDSLVQALPLQEAIEVRDLEQYPPDTAGGIMTPQVTALRENLTVEQAIAELRRMRQEIGEMFYVYIVDAHRRLKGVINMRDLILSPPDTPIRRILRRDVTTVPVTMDQEQVADLFRRYNYLALPVVSPDRRLLGIVTIDDVVDVISQEATEDLQKLAGAGPEERLTSSWHFSFRKRILWLVVNLATAFLAAAVVGAFEDMIARLAVLAVYLPVVAGMGGNASAQAMAVAIRGIALGEVDRSRLRHVLIRELLVGLVSGAVIGLITAVVAWSVHYDQGVMLGIAVAIALVLTMISACLAGVAIPFLMKSMGFDPAQSATIFVTTVTDFVGFLSFLGLSYLLI